MAYSSTLLLCIPIWDIKDVPALFGTEAEKEMMRVKNTCKFTMMLLVSAIIMIMTGCVSTTYLDNGIPRYVTSVTHFGEREVKAKTFYIESGDEAISSNDVEFKEYAGYIAEELKIDGAIETTDKENADICILMNYCITDESYQETIPVPEYGRTSIASTTTKGSTTTYQYNYGTTGYHYVQNNVSNFVRVVNVYAYDNKSRDGEPIMLWKINFKSTGSSSDLKKVIPYMILTERYCYGSIDRRVILENDHFFKVWKQKRFSKPNYYLLDEFKYTPINGNSFDGIPIYVEKEKVETVICFAKTGCRSYRISPELYLVSNGRETKVRYAENYELGNTVKKECGLRYFVLHFPVNIDTIDSFEIREYTNGSHTRYNTWGAIELMKD